MDHLTSTDLSRINQLRAEIATADRDQAAAREAICAAHREHERRYHAARERAEELRRLLMALVLPPNEQFMFGPPPCQPEG